MSLMQSPQWCWAERLVAGGRGTILGTVLGLFSISVLQNGLHLAALPSELTGILTGSVLVLTIAMDRVRARGETTLEGEATEMKNSQVAILCGAILAGSLITAGANVWLVKSLKAPAAAASVGHTPVIAVMPKAKGDPYFVSCRIGAEEGGELGVELIRDGPTSLDAAKQNEIV